jgi:peptide/nickel transport system ATP-binding protein
MYECLDHPPEFDAEGTDEHRARCVLADHEYDASEALPDDYFESGSPAETGRPETDRQSEDAATSEVEQDD